MYPPASANTMAAPVVDLKITTEEMMKNSGGRVGHKIAAVLQDAVGNVRCLEDDVIEENRAVSFGMKQIGAAQIFAEQR